MTILPMLPVKRFLWKVRLSFMGDIIQNYSQYERLQWIDKEKLNNLCSDKLKRLLTHAYQHVPYYREILRDAGVIRDNGTVNLESFKQIPLLDKSIIRDNFERLRSDDLKSRKWYENTSGGSTGEPVRFIQDRDYFQLRTSLVILQDLWSGYSICEKRIILWGSERDIFSGKERFRTNLGRWLRNEIWLNAFRMTSEQMHEYVKCINDFKPVQILAYTESIYELSRFIEREKLSIYSPMSIMVSAGVLQMHMRETIERVFKAPVFNRYGSREVGPIACECDHHEGLHVFPLNYYIEILRHDGTPAAPGESGEVVITSLTNFAMPLIRYRIGDMGAWSENPCTCGRAWPLLKYVAGRVSDVFITKDGTQIHGEYFTHLFYFQNWVNKFRVIQEDYDLIRIFVVANKQVDTTLESHAKEINMITKKIHLVMGQDCKVEFEFVNDIAPTASGKYRYTISRVSNKPH
ncbi:MAG: phenylacetate--CoA ligase family protein [Thermodesulfovibrionales bacterium]